jgi:hypothetical protein
VAAFVADVEPDLLDDLTRLTHQVEAGQRIPQPRLRHRLQDDQVGLTGYQHRLVGTGEELLFELDRRGAPGPNVLGAVYAAGRIDAEHRPAVFAALRRGLRWRGEIGPELVGVLSDARSTTNWATLGGRDPVLWALGTSCSTGSVTSSEPPTPTTAAPPTTPPNASTTSPKPGASSCWAEPLPSRHPVPVPSILLRRIRLLFSWPAFGSHHLVPPMQVLAALRRFDGVGTVGVVDRFPRTPPRSVASFSRLAVLLRPCFQRGRSVACATWDAVPADPAG